MLFFFNGKSEIIQFSNLGYRFMLDFLFYQNVILK